MQARKVLLLDDAKHDLVEIRLYVYRASKSKQVADSYLKKIRHSFRFLAYTAAASPRFFYQNGKDSGYRFCVAENHVGFFTFDDDHVYIKRVLYKRADAGRALLL